MSFEHVIGHEFAKRTLREALRNHRVGHAYLFWGRDGVGKRTFARAFAKNLFCTGDGHEAGDDSCGHCRSCQKIESDNHPDVTITTEDDAAQAAVTIGAVRRLRDEVHMRAVEGRWKLFLVDDVHRLRAEAATALLKTLEEPPPGSIFILCADDLMAVKDTIRSRCQALLFRPIPSEALREFLIGERGLSAQESDLAVRLAHGSPGGSIRLADGGFLAEFALHRSLWLGRFLGQTGVGGLSALADLSKKNTKTPAEARVWLVQALKLGTAFLRELLLFLEGFSDGTAPFSDLGDGDGVVGQVDPLVLAEFIEDLLQACTDIGRNVGAPVVLADLELQLRRIVGVARDACRAQG